MVDDDYRLLNRILGRYPISALAVLRGVERLRMDTFREFAKPLSGLPVTGSLIRYGPPADGTEEIAAEEVATIIAASADNPLRIPLPDERQRQRLFSAFAPVFEIDTVSNDDRIGAPFWGDAEYAEVDTGKPNVYQRISHVRYGAMTLLQLNYVVWFPARPRTHVFDLLGGRLDGINWRVTVGSDGRPLLFEAIHNCGCYHMFSPPRGYGLSRRNAGYCASLFGYLIMRPD